MWQVFSIFLRLRLGLTSFGGPASSQVGMALGLLRAGVQGALEAWLRSTLPSALLLALFGMGLAHGQLALPAGAVQRLKVIPVANYSAAEDYHDNYHARNPHQNDCSAVEGSKVDKLCKNFVQFLKPDA